MSSTRDQLLRIGTRRSPLALWQANHVRARLLEAHADLEIELVEIQTLGDKVLDSPLSKIGDKGLFTREIERALLDGRIDAAVHSLKDLPTVLPDGLEIGAVCEREDPRDALVAKNVGAIAELPHGAVVAKLSLESAGDPRSPKSHCTRYMVSGRILVSHAYTVPQVSQAWKNGVEPSRPSAWT